jgi:hypothetical protein
MSSDVSISNLALQRLGQKSISNLTDTGLLPEQCNMVYQATVYELLESYEWPFAITRAQLGWVETPATYYNPYSYVYNKPADSLRILAILDGAFADSTSMWIIEGAFLYTDEINPLYVRYIDKTVLEANFPELFVTAVYLRMAMKMCLKITQDQNLLGQISQEFTAAYQMAASTLGVNDKQDQQPDSLWSK